MNQSEYRFKTLLQQVSGAERLLPFLDTTDFYTAPASLKYHDAEEGGLVRHSLKVYNNLCKLNDLYKTKLSNESMIKVALLHELGKINFYEVYFKNIKDENDNWVKVPTYKVKEAENRDVFGDSGLNSYVIASRYINFTDDEITALCNYNHVNDPGTHMEINTILSKSPLTLLLYLADMLAMYVNDDDSFIE